VNALRVLFKPVAMGGLFIALACGSVHATGTDDATTPDAAEVLLELRVAIALTTSTDEVLEQAQSLRGAAAAIVAALDDPSTPEGSAATPEQKQFAATQLALADGVLEAALKNALMARANLAAAQHDITRLPSSGDAPGDSGSTDGGDDVDWTRSSGDLHRAVARRRMR
jgi:hypothetical protein